MPKHFENALTFSFGREALDDDDSTSQILPGPLPPTEARNFPSGLHRTTKVSETKSLLFR